MRLNKKKLAALAMSAVMAASTMPFPVMAEEFTSEAAVEDFADVPEQDAEQSSDAYVVVPESIKFFYEGTGSMDVTYKRKNVATGAVEEKEEKTTAVVEKETAATCTDPAYVWLKVTIDDVIYHSGKTDDKKTAFVKVENGKLSAALGHDWDIKDNEGYVDEYPTCTEEGLAHYHAICKRCNLDDPNHPVTLEKLGHKYGEDKVRYTNLVNVEIKDGKPQLIDILKDGTYTEVTYHVCVRCGQEEVIKTENKTILAEKVTMSRVTAQEGLAATVDYIGWDPKYVPENDKIELADCTKDGRYQITTYAKSADNEVFVPVSQRWVTVKAHHMIAKTIEFKNAEDEKQCTVNETTLKVTNNSCWKTITYYEVDHCTAAGCPNDKCDTKQFLCHNTDLKLVNRTEKTAKPEGEHIYNSDIEKIVKAEAAKTYADYDMLVQLAKTDKNYVKVSDLTATCTKDGTAKVTLLCKICKHEGTTYTVNVKALGHDPQLPVEENVKKETCQEMGQYDAVIYCGRCKEVLVRRTVKTPRHAHSNESYVSANGVGVNDDVTDATAYIKFIGNKVVDPKDGSYLSMVGKTLTSGNYAGYGGEKTTNEFGIFAKAYTNCTECHDHEVELVTANNVTLKIVDVQKQKETGEAGSITIEASYTRTITNGTAGSKTEVITEQKQFPYFTTMESYQGRTEDIPLNGLYKDDNGVYRYYVNNEFAKDYSGIVEFNGEKFFVANGILASDANGLNEFGGKWYFLSNGQIQRTHTGLAEYNGEWFYIVNGRLDTAVNGLVPYNGGMFVFAEGRLCKQANGLWQDSDGTWYFLALGQVQTQHTGVAEYDGSFFYIRNGKLATDYNGTVEYDGAKFKVVAGQLYDKIA